MTMDPLKLETNGDPTLAGVASLLAMLESDDPLPLPGAAEPVIEAPVSWRNTAQEPDPLDWSNDFRIVPVESLICATSNQTKLSTVLEDFEVKLEVDDIEEVPIENDLSADSTVPSLPQTTACSILLDRNEILKYYCPNTKTFKFTSEQQSSLKILKCNLCKNSTFKSKKDIQSHMDIHHRSSINKAKQCMKCSESFAKSSDLKIHMDLKHVYYVCKYCNESLTSSCKLKRHISMFHKSVDNKLISTMSESDVDVNNLMGNVSETDDTYEEICNNHSPSQSIIENKLKTNMKLRSNKQNNTKNVDTSKQYTCKDCDSNFKNKLELKKHCIIKHKLIVDSMRCDFCGKEKFYDKNELKHHIISSHLKHTYYCKICETRFTHKGFLILHKNKIHSNNKCKLIGLKLVSINGTSKYRKSIANSNYIKRDYISCSKCSYVSAKSIYVNRHLLLKHGDQFDHVCKYCYLPFAKERTLLRHLETKHKGKVGNIKTNKNIPSNAQLCSKKVSKCEPYPCVNGMYKCLKCTSVSFKNQFNLNWHKALKHDAIFKHMCEHCHKPFASKKGLGAHVRNLHKIYKSSCKSSNNNNNNKSKDVQISKRFSCKICNTPLRSKGALKSHCLAKHPLAQKIVCDLCKENSFFSRNDIKTHMLTKHFRHSFHCTICDTRFTLRGFLKNHKNRMHTNLKCKIVGLKLISNDDRKYLVSKNKIQNSDCVCPKCSYKACKSIYLKRHLYLKHGEIFDHICKYCHLPYTQKIRLERHIKLKHGAKERKNTKMTSQTQSIQTPLISSVHQFSQCSDVILKDQSDLKQRTNIKHDENLQNISHKPITHKSSIGKNLVLKHKNKSSRDFKQFFCKLCKSSYSNNYTLKYHYLTMHPMENIITCDICKQTNFTDKNDIKSHMLLKHIRNSYHCTICDSRFTLRGFLENHKNRLHANLKCKIVGLKIISNDVKKYLVPKSKILNGDCVCPKCPYKACANIYIKRHLYRKHGETFDHICKYCNLPFSQKRFLESHIKAKHAASKETDKTEKKETMSKSNKAVVSYLCHICNENFESLLSLQNHLYNIHKFKFKNRILLHSCRLCNANLEEKRGQIKIHLEYIHGINFKLKCKFCKLIINNNEEMTIHMAKKHFKEIYERTSTYNVRMNFMSNVNEDEIISENFCQKYCDENAVNYENLTFTCKLCNIDFKSYPLLKSHIINHSKGRPYICFHCRHPFKYLSGLRRHLKNDHLLTKTLTCNDCDKQFYFKSSLKDHITMEHLNMENNSLKEDIEIENYSYYCLTCNLMLENEHNYKSHCTTFHSSNFACASCDMKFISKIDIENHIRDNKCTRKVKKSCKTNYISCKMCSKKYKKILLLKAHILSEHGVVPGTCPYCELKYRRLGLHVVQNHFNTYQCNYCNAKFKGKANLKRHLNTVHYKEKLQCKDCAINFSCKLELSEHCKLFHGKVNSHLCHLCGRDFPENCVLKSHIRRCHKGKRIEEKRDRILCSKCDKSFSSLACLNKHVSEKHNKILYSCLSCKFKSKTKHMLKKHEFSEHKIGNCSKFKNFYRRCSVREFKCSQCFYSFTAEQFLINHYNREHEPCVCDICDRQLQGKHSMEKHLEYSHGMKEKVYPCKKCKHVALTPGRLQKHLVAKHKKKF